MTSSPLRLSYSALKEYETCPRLFQINRLIYQEKAAETSEHLSFGKAVGAGFQSLLAYKDLERALFDCFLAYEPMIETAEDSTKEKKTFERACMAIEVASKEWDFSSWELLTFNGKPATELSFKLVLNDEGDYYCGYVDAVLRHLPTGKLTVIDCKTTGLNLFNLEALYKHSPQALSYSIVLDDITPSGNLFTVFYIVFQLKKPHIYPILHSLPFTKTRLDRLNWLLTVQGQLAEIKQGIALDFFRQRELGCYRYGRTCPLINVCDLQLEAAATAEQEEEDWDIVVTFDQLLELNQQNFT